MTCETCEKNLESEIEEKAEEKGRDELNETEIQILESDGDEEVDYPFAYGPLSGADVPYCSFCFKIGLLLSVIFGALVGAGVWYEGLATRPVLVGAAVTIILGAIVGYLGRFPVLGAVFGPIFESAFASFGIYLTAKAEQEHKTEEETESTDSTPEIPIEAEAAKVEADESDDNPTQEPDVDAGRYKQLAERKRREKQQIRQQKEDLEKEAKELEDELKSTHKEKKKLKQQVDEFRNTLELAGSFGQNRDQDPVAADAAPVYVKSSENGVPIGPFWMTDIVRYDHDHWGEVPIPFGVWDLSELGQIPSEPVELVEQEDLPTFGEYLMFDPSELDHPIDFVSPDHTKFDPENDVPLFTQTVATRDKVQTRLMDPTIEPQSHKEEIEKQATHAVLVLGIDTAGQPVPLEHDVSGFEVRQKLRSQKREKARKARRFRSEKKRREEQIEDLQHELELLEEEKGRLKDALEKARKHEREALEGRQAIDQSMRVMERSNRHLQSELDHTKTERDLVDQERRKHRKEKLTETNSIEEERQQAEAQHDVVSKDAAHVEKIRRVWDHPDIDPDRLPDADYGPTYDEYIRDFLDADVGKQAEKVQKDILGNLVGGEV